MTNTSHTPIISVKVDGGGTHLWKDFENGSGYRVANPGHLVEGETEQEVYEDFSKLALAYNSHDDLVSALEEISRGAGVYSTDPLEHAGNCIDEMKAIAIAALAKAKGNQL